MRYSSTPLSVQDAIKKKEIQDETPEHVFSARAPSSWKRAIKRHAKSIAALSAFVIALGAFSYSEVRDLLTDTASASAPHVELINSSDLVTTLLIIGSPPPIYYHAYHITDRAISLLQTNEGISHTEAKNQLTSQQDAVVRWINGSFYLTATQDQFNALVGIAVGEGSERLANEFDKQTRLLSQGKKDNTSLHPLALFYAVKAIADASQSATTNAFAAEFAQLTAKEFAIYQQLHEALEETQAQFAHLSLAASQTQAKHTPVEPSLDAVDPIARLTQIKEEKEAAYAKHATLLLAVSNELAPIRVDYQEKLHAMNTDEALAQQPITRSVERNDRAAEATFLYQAQNAVMRPLYPLTRHLTGLEEEVISLRGIEQALALIEENAFRYGIKTAPEHLNVLTNATHTLMYSNVENLGLSQAEAQAVFDTLSVGVAQSQYQPFAYQVSPR